MKQTFDYLNAMHVVVNGGAVSREAWNNEAVIKLNEHEEVCEYIIDENGKLSQEELMVVTVQDVKANDWFVYELDKQNPVQLAFEELEAQICDLVCEMDELDSHELDDEQLSVLEYLKVALKLYDDEEECQCPYCNEAEYNEIGNRKFNYGGITTDEMLDKIDKLANELANKFKGLEC